jgi:hypothetical protein
MNTKTVVAIISLIPLLALCVHAQTADQMMQGMKNMQIPQGAMEMVKKLQDKSLDEQKKQMKKNGMHTEKSDLESFAKKVRLIVLNEDTPDEVRTKLGSPQNISKQQGCTIWIYSFMPNYNEIMASFMNSTAPSKGMSSLQSVNGVIQFDSNDKVCFVEVTKSGTGRSDIMYTKGTPPIPEQLVPQSSQSNSVGTDHFPLKEAAPENPTEGQIYFNKTDKHFYGWDGASWLKLDTKP